MRVIKQALHSYLCMKLILLITYRNTIIIIYSQTYLARTVYVTASNHAKTRGNWEGKRSD